MEDEQRVDITNYKSKYKGDPLYTVYGPKMLSDKTLLLRRRSILKALRYLKLLLPISRVI